MVQRYPRPRFNARWRDRPRNGIPLRAVPPNAVTALALCFGLSAVRFAIAEQWQLAVGTIVLAAILDGLDGRIARMLNGESRFGAELDSLSDAIAFGVSPAVVMYLWSLQYMPQFGWTIALSHAVCCALRLARFNAQIDETEQPRKAAGFFTGIPAPAGAGLVMAPLYLWLAFDEQVSLFRSAYIVAPWTAMSAILMVSSVATYSWKSLRLRRHVRFEAIAVIALLGTAVIGAPWPTLSVVIVGYLLTIPFSARSYARIRRQRASAVPMPSAPIASDRPT